MTHFHQSPPRGGQQDQAATPTADMSVPKFAEGPWGEAENSILCGAIEAIQGHPIRTTIESSDRDKDKSLKWCNIAARCQALGCRRNAKQCRERYINHMAPGRRDKIGPEEGRRIMELVALHGQKWASIGRELNRPENTVKNYWNQERKKRENGKKRTSSHSHQPSHQADAGRQYASRPYSYPQVSREEPHSRRESLSSNPGLVSDRGSPVELSPRSSRHNSFGPVQQLQLPPFHGWKPAPASPLQPGYQMDRTQALSASSAYSTEFLQMQGSSPTHEQFHQRGQPLISHQSGRLSYADHPGSQQQQSSVDSGHNRASSGIEESQYTYGYARSHGQHRPSTNAAHSTLPIHNQTYPVAHGEAYQQQSHRGSWAREQQHESGVVPDFRYSYAAPQQSSAIPQMDLPYRTQRGALPSLSTLLNSDNNTHQTPRPNSVGAPSSKRSSVQASPKEMDLRRILN